METRYKDRNNKVIP
uniref:Uncharacterized protein n=1 Tax=Lepeophtheirus salmonis TaxID=72036 RepID=A0A0K2TQ54_LEPSM